MRAVLGAGLIVCGSLMASEVRAQEWWLTATPSRAAAGDSVAVRAWTGAGFVGAPERDADAHMRRFTCRDSATHDVELQSRAVGEPLARFAAADAGGISLAYESGFARIETPPAAFETRLLEAGLEWVSRARMRRGHQDRAGTERAAHCARTWVSGDSSARVRAAAGLTLEWVPLHDPTRPGPAALELRLRSRPLSAALVRMWHRPERAAARRALAPAFQGRTDLDGRIRLPDLGPGAYLVAVRFMEPCPEPGEADWQSLSTSLTFARARPSARDR